MDYKVHEDLGIRLSLGEITEEEFIESAQVDFNELVSRRKANKEKKFRAWAVAYAMFTVLSGGLLWSYASTPKLDEGERVDCIYGFENPHLRKECEGFDSYWNQ